MSQKNITKNNLNNVWTDIDSYEYRTGYKLSEKIDMIIMLFLLIKIQNLNYQKNYL